MIKKIFFIITSTLFFYPYATNAQQEILEVTEQHIESISKLLDTQNHIKRLFNKLNKELIAHGYGGATECKKGTKEYCGKVNGNIRKILRSLEEKGMYPKNDLSFID